MWGFTDKVRFKCVLSNVTHLLNLSMYGKQIEVMFCVGRKRGFALSMKDKAF